MYAVIKMFLVLTAADGSWDCAEPDVVISVSNSTAPVNRMLIVSGKLWCACLNDVIVLSVPALNVEVRHTRVAGHDDAGLHGCCQIPSKTLLRQKRSIFKIIL